MKIEHHDSKLLHNERCTRVLLKERPRELTFNQTYFNHCSCKLIQSLTKLAISQLHNVTGSETELKMIQKNTSNNSSMAKADLLGNSDSRFVQSDA